MGKLSYFLPLIPLAYSLLVPWMVFNSNPEANNNGKAILRAICFCFGQLLMSWATLVLLAPVIVLGGLASSSIRGSSTALAPLFGAIVLAGAGVLVFVSATILRYFEKQDQLTFKTPRAPYVACALLLVVQVLTVLLAITRPGL